MNRWTARAILATLATLAILGSSQVQLDMEQNLLWLHAPHSTLLALLAFFVAGTAAVVAVLAGLVYLIAAATGDDR